MSTSRAEAVDVSGAFLLCWFPIHGVVVPLCIGKMLLMAQKGWGGVGGWSLALSCSLDAPPRYVDGRVIVIEVLPGSQAEVDEVVLAGDVLDEINGFSLRNAYRGQVGGMTSSSPRSSLCAFPLRSSSILLSRPG